MFVWFQLDIPDDLLDDLDLEEDEAILREIEEKHLVKQWKNYFPSSNFHRKCSIV